MKFLYKTSKDSNFLSLTSLLIGILILSYQDALIKFIANDTTFWQLQFIRSFFNIMFLYIIVILSQNKSLLIPENWLPVTIRGAMIVLCMFCFFSASPILSLSQMAAGLYTFPIFVTILSIVITKEMVVGGPSSHLVSPTKGWKVPGRRIYPSHPAGRFPPREQSRVNRFNI